MSEIRAFVKDNRLHFFGVEDSDFGALPYAYSVTLNQETPDGPVDIGSESLPESVTLALETSAPEIRRRILIERIKAASEDLVIRARVGDQNAMALLTEIGKAANQGVPRAVLAKSHLARYIQANPPGNYANPDGRIAKQLAASSDGIAIAAYIPGINSVSAGAVAIANGKLTKPKLNRVRSVLTDSEKAAFDLGYRQGYSRDIAGRIGKSMAAYKIGCCVNLARRLQTARKPGGKIAALSRNAAWELGE